MANMTLAEYIRFTKQFMGEDPDDTDNERYTDAVYTQFLNEAQCEIAEELGNQMKMFRVTAAVDAVSGAITPPANYLSGIKGSILPSVTEQGYPLEHTTRSLLQAETPSWLSITAARPTTLVEDDSATGTFWYLYPQPDATIEDGFQQEYTARPIDMAADGDTSAVMNLFPSMQSICLPAGALKRVYLMEHGEQDEQYMKWSSIFTQQIAMMIKYKNNRHTYNSTWGRGR